MIYEKDWEVLCQAPGHNIGNKDTCHQMAFYLKALSSYIPAYHKIHEYIAPNRSPEKYNMVVYLTLVGYFIIETSHEIQIILPLIGKKLSDDLI
jgi:hypothetical protein